MTKPSNDWMDRLAATSRTAEAMRDVEARGGSQRAMNTALRDHRNAMKEAFAAFGLKPKRIRTGMWTGLKRMRLR